MDRLNRRIDQLGAAETFRYDGSGNLVSTTDRKGQTTTFSYDPVNRRTQATYADGAVATFSYDAAGRLVQADDSADPHRPVTLAYDSLDRLLAETTSLGTVSYQYDVLGRRRQMTVGGQAPVDYTYDANSRLRTIAQSSFLSPVTIDYDALNRRTLLTLPNGVSTEYVYDPGSRLSALIYRNALGLLGDLTYRYDPSGNRIGVGGSFARTLLPDPVPSATYDAASRQLAFGDRMMTYDDNGNLTTITDATGSSIFTWDSRNQLHSMNSPTHSATFKYDARGRRIHRSINGKVTLTLYDGLHSATELSNSGLPAFHLRGLNLDEILLRHSAADTNLFLTDALGSVVGVVGEAGMLNSQYNYEPFGITVSTDNTLDVPYQFTGRENDGTGLYFYRARYYSPRLHRFISADPIGLKGGINPYTYVNNNPVSFSDPLGLDTYAFGVAGSVGYTATSGRGVTETASVLVAADPKGEVGFLYVHGPLATFGTPGPSAFAGLQGQVTDAQSIEELVGPFRQGSATLAAPVPIGGVPVPPAVSGDVFAGEAKRNGRVVRVEGSDYIVGFGTPGFSLSGGVTETKLLYSFNLLKLLGNLSCRKCAGIGP